MKGRVPSVLVLVLNASTDYAMTRLDETSAYD